LLPPAARGPSLGWNAGYPAGKCVVKPWWFDIVVDVKSYGFGPNRDYCRDIYISARGREHQFMARYLPLGSKTARRGKIKYGAAAGTAKRGW
jgi:hypothetical protein